MALNQPKSVFVQGDLQVVFAGISGIKCDPVTHAPIGGLGDERAPLSVPSSGEYGEGELPRLALLGVQARPGAAVGVGKRSRSRLPSDP